MANRNGGFIGTDGLDAPDPPTGVTPTTGNEQVSVAFTAPTDTGTSAITGFVVQVSTDGTDYSAGSNTGSSSPIVVTSLTNDTAATAKVWAINAYGTSAPSDASASFTPALIQTALWAAINNSSNRIDTMSLSTTGNSSDFGDLTVSRHGPATLASSTRGVFAGGHNSNSVTIDYVTILTSGNATDFGDMITTNGAYSGGLSNDTRGLIFGGDEAAYYNQIQYITIASTGNAQDFGDLSYSPKHPDGSASSTIGVMQGGRTNTNPAETNIMNSVTIGSLGNGSDFGNLTVARYQGASCSSSTRGLHGGGFKTQGGNTFLDTIDYITFSSLGDASDFGNLSAARRQLGAASGVTYGTFASGYGGGANLDTIDYVTIASTGNASDWGDLTAAGQDAHGLSNCHGGI